MTEILARGPVTASFVVYEDIFRYTGGIYHKTKDSGRQIGGHAIKIIGWGEEKGAPYWIIANSWGADWGENGYFRIMRGRNECGIEQDVHVGSV